MRRAVWGCMGLSLALLGANGGGCGSAESAGAGPSVTGSGGGTTALEVGDEIWFGSFKGTRIARLPAPK